MHTLKCSVLSIALVSWLLVGQGCTFLDHPPRPPIVPDLIGRWVGTSNFSEAWSVVLDSDGGGHASVVRLADKHMESLVVRSWSLCDFDFVMVTDATEAMRPQESAIKLRGQATRGSIELRSTSKYWDRAIILTKEREFREAMDVLSIQ